MNATAEACASRPLGESCHRSRPCHVIGVLDDGAASLSRDALAHLQEADCVIGASRALSLFASDIAPSAERRELTGALSQVPEWVRSAQARGQRCVVLATGDPLCHGIASYLAAKLCIDALRIVPNLSTIQIACARIGLPWQDMRLASVHFRDAGEWTVGADARHGLYGLAQDVRRYDRLAVLTSPDNSPDRIARLLLAERLGDDFQLAVAENLCQRDERVHAPLSTAEAARRRFAELNVMLLWRTRLREHPVLFGAPESLYSHRRPERGLITKSEVRAVALARMQLRSDSIVWDIGAGSGAVGLEAARLCTEGHVYAIEKNQEDFALAFENRAAFALSNHTLVHGKAPDGLDDWPSPDSVFIGGSGGELLELIAMSVRRLKSSGWLVMSFVTLENLATATAALENAALDAVVASWDVLQLQASRSRPILHMHRLAAENPVWLVCAQKGDTRA